MMTLGLPKPPLPDKAAEHLAHVRHLIETEQAFEATIDEQLAWHRKPFGAVACLAALTEAPNRADAVAQFCDEEQVGVEDIIWWALDVYQRLTRTAALARSHLGTCHRGAGWGMAAEAYWSGVLATADPTSTPRNTPGAGDNEEAPF